MAQEQIHSGIGADQGERLVQDPLGGEGMVLFLDAETKGTAPSACLEEQFHRVGGHGIVSRLQGRALPAPADRANAAAGPGSRYPDTPSLVSLEHKAPGIRQESVLVAVQ